MKFEELNLPSKILKSLKDMGFEDMTPIQEMTYPVIFSGQDLCALAETGSGKTAACAIPLVHKVDPELNAIQALVIVPIRELCIQYVAEIQSIATNTHVAPFGVYGGFSKSIQVAKLKHGVHILVATPGRLLDLLYDGIIDLTQVRCVILDEADELLKAGFLEDIERIMSCIRHEHQTLLFAATMAPDIRRMTDEFLKTPAHISLIKARAAPVSIEHWFNYVHPKDKQAALITYLETEKIKQVIIFCNARHKVDKLFSSLRKKISDVECIHAGLSQDKRSSIFRRFKSGKISCLIATDVAGRGLDFSRVSHVVNWNFAGVGEQYTHRTGRTGRMGRKGKALTFITKHDLETLRKLVVRNKITCLWIGKDPFKANIKPDTEKHVKASGRPGTRKRGPRRT